MDKQIEVNIYLLNGNAVIKQKDVLNYDTESFQAFMDIDVPESVSEIYVEFSSISIFKDLVVFSDKGKMKYKNLNGTNIKNLDYFVTEKPKISIDVRGGGISYLRLKFEMFNFNRDYIDLINDFIELSKSYSEKEEACIKIEEELKELAGYKQKYLDILPETEELRRNIEELKGIVEYKQKYLDMLDIKADLESKVNSLQVQYDSINNSKCWKLTKPLRVCLDVLKNNKITKWLKNPSKVVEEIKEDTSEDEINSFENIIKITAVVAVNNPNEAFFADTIRSLLAQKYNNFEIYIVNFGTAITKEFEKVLKSISKKDKRIVLKKLKNGLSKAQSISVALKNATGDYIVLVNAEDMIAEDAFLELARVVNKDSADFIYCDEDKVKKDVNSTFDPYFKPDFAPDTLRTHNYISNFIAFNKHLLEEVDLNNLNADAYDYDLTLRLTEKSKKIVHIPKLLYHMRYMGDEKCEYVFPKQYNKDAAINVISEHLKRIGRKGVVTETGYPNIYRVTYNIQIEPLISIIILNKDKIEYLKKCIESVLNKSTYRNYEIIVVENNSEEAKTFEYYKKIASNKKVKVIEYEKGQKFNFSAINNFAVKTAANGEMILLLNNDTEVINPNWLEEMLMYAQFDEVGIVGAKLYYPNGALQHVGVGVGLMGVSAHYFLGYPKDFHGYFGRINCAQDLGAVTGACLMIRRKVFDEVNGLDEGLAVAYNDIDLCLKVLTSGYKIIFTPYTELYHAESLTRGYSDATYESSLNELNEKKRFCSAWKDFLAKGDPYFNINLPHTFDMKPPKQ